MARTCFFCRKPLPVERRGTVFCSARCQELEAQMQAAASDRSESGRFAPSASGRPGPKGPPARPAPAQSHPRGAR